MGEPPRATKYLVQKVNRAEAEKPSVMGMKHELSELHNESQNLTSII